MAILRPIGKNTKVALFKKETTEGVFVAPSQSHHVVSESLKYTPQSIEDPSNIGKLFTTDMIKSGYNVEGSVEMKAHPYFIGDALFFALGKEDTPVNPAQGYIIIWYTGAAKYARIKKVTTVFTAETSTDGTTYAADAAFGTAGDYEAVGKKLSEIVTAINGFTGYKAAYVGYGDAPVANLAAFSATVIVSNGLNVGAIIKPFLVSSAIAYMHPIYADDSSLSDIPSFSIAIDRSFGAGKDVGLAGCKISSLTLASEPKNLVGMTMSVKAKVQDNSYTYAAADVPVSRAFTTNNMKVYVDTIVSQEVKDISLTINNNMFTDEAVGEETYASQGRQGATLEASGNLNLTVATAGEDETIGLQARMQADEPVEIIVYMESDDYADLANNVKYSALFRLRSVKLTDCSPVISGPDRLTLPFTGMGVASTFGNHLDVYVTNMTAAY